MAAPSNWPWVIGALANNIWSYAGDDDQPDVNQFLLNYFINYNLPQGWYISSAPISTPTGRQTVATNGLCPSEGVSERFFGSESSP